MLYNANRGEGDAAKTADDFNPYRRRAAAARKLPLKERFAALKMELLREGAIQPEG